MMRVDVLVALCPPPARPVDAIGDWDALESELGLSLPMDFKNIATTYGDGVFADFLYLLAPFSKEDGSCLASCSAGLLGAERAMRQEFPEDYDHPLHPEPGGLFPWARTANGDVLFWRTEGDPSEWTTVASGARGPERQSFDLGTCGFLFGWLSGEIDCSLFPQRTEYFECRFDPRRELSYLDVYFRFVDDAFDDRLARVRALLGLPTLREKQLQDDYSHAQLRADDDIAKVQYSDNGQHGARLNLLFPPADDSDWKERVRALRDAEGWKIWRVSDASGGKYWPELVTD